MAERVSGILAGRGLRCSDIEMDVSERCFVLVFRLHYFKRLDLIELLEEISSLDGVSSVSSLEQTTEL
jgi:transcriptional regulator of aromatic amino acid metabolism